MINILVNNRTFAIALAVTMSTAFSAPAIANEKNDSIPVELKYKGTNVASNYIPDTDVVHNGNIRSEISGKKKNKKVVSVDFSWYKPEPPQDINPYDKIQLDFSWYIPSNPMDRNPFAGRDIAEVAE